MLTTMRKSSEGFKNKKFSILNILNILDAPLSESQIWSILLEVTAQLLVFKPFYAYVDNLVNASGE
jgi:hypothetical protein